MRRPRLSTSDNRSGPRARRRVKDLKKAHDHQGRLLIGGSLALIALTVILGATVFHSVKLDKATGCPVGRHMPVAHTLILLDETDRLSRDDLVYANSVVRTEYLWLPVGGRLTVRSIVADTDVAHDIVVCRMEDQEKVLGIAKNKNLVKRNFETTAGARLSTLWTSLQTAPPQAYSPILEFIAAAMDRPDFGKNVKARRLVVISDFAQHSDLASHYGKPQAFRLSSEAKSELARDMTGVAVRLHYIRRRKLAALQGERHKNFWRSYIEGLGADVAIGHDLLIGEKTNRETWTDAPQ